MQLRGTELNSLATDILDEILAIQFLVAWAGEGLCEPPRLGWWETDLVDELGGGDFLQRLLPNTHQWAALQAVREAARQQAEAARKSSAEADRIRSLYHLGYEVDRQLEERLRELKSSGTSPTEALPHLSMIDEGFDAQAFAAWLEGLASVDTRQTPGGRRIKGNPPAEALQRARCLAAAHVPFDTSYPQPYLEA